MSDNIYDRIKKACVAMNNEACYGQERELSDGQVVTMQRLALEFVYPDGLGGDHLVSEMMRDGKKIVLHLGPMAELVGNKVSSTNADLIVLAARVMFRELWWYNKGVKKHETTLDYLQSPESKAAFQSGFSKAIEQNFGRRE